ncbi:MAG TPA: DNA-processing protein DprA [Candidatus Limnocylindrales bacterium]|nr:DNA-processing protein DprA [Candidatus Limnocylindrales bacterium]
MSDTDADRISEREAWIVLSSVDGIGEILMPLLVSTFRGARNVLAATRDGGVAAFNEDWRRRNGRPALNTPAFAELVAAAHDPAKLLGKLDELGLWTYTSLDADYPPRLRDLDPPPAVIHGAGEPSHLCADKIVAIVGTRRPTPDGRDLAGRVARRLVEFGAVVVSGLAVGIDGAAHAAVVEKDAPTIGVIGGGHLFPGPRAHRRLRGEVVAKGGAIISERYPTVHPTIGTYPRRNRIIAALGDATIVIEAPRKSGALITAKAAMEIGRPVFVAPGRIGDWSTVGSLNLLRESPARPLVGIDELIEDLGFLKAPAGQTEAVVPLLQSLSPTERAVAERLKVAPAGLDALVADTGLPPGTISSAVTLLMLRGWAQSIGPAYAAAGPLAR